MEKFRGELANYRLQLLAPALFEAEGATGLLVVERGATRREFQIVAGCMVSERSNEPREHLTQLLADLKILPAAKAAEAFERAEASGIKFGKYLIENDLVDKPRLVEAMCHKAREAFCDCYLWENGEISFAPGGQVVPGVPISMKLSALHRDGMARVREWRAFRDVFPADDLTFRVDRESAGMLAPAEDQLLIHLAEAGASLGELLAASKEGRYAVSRRILRFYRKGVLSPRAASGKRVGMSAGMEELIQSARLLLQEGKFADAAAVAEQALELAPVPEAHALYRDAELKLALAISDEVFALEGKIHCEPVPSYVPTELTADDLYLHAKLRGCGSVRQTIRTAAMGELQAYKSVQRLIGARLLVVANTPPMARRKTDPYGLPVVS